jgi:hypothetical protein
MIKFAVLNKKLLFMRRGVIAFILIFCFVSLANAQDYKNGIGISAGYSAGVTFKHFNSEKVALEGLFTTRWAGFGLTGLYEVHNQTFDVERLKWYYGGGVHIGFYNGDHVPWGEPGTGYTVVGIDGIIGIEYTFKEAPINLGINWKPVLDLTGNPGLWSEGALTVRFVF